MSVSGIGVSRDSPTPLQRNSGQGVGSANTNLLTTAANRFDKICDYYAYLQSNHSYLGKTAMVYGVQTSVNVSEDFMRQGLRAARGATLVSAGYNIDENGNISMVTTTTNDPDGSIARENAQKKTGKAKETEEDAEQRAGERRKKKTEDSETVTTWMATSMKELLARMTAARKEQQVEGAMMNIRV